MNDRIEKIARAVLYEGYLLYPYRPSAVKNRRRWNFGVLFPERADLVRKGLEASRIQAECLVTGGAGTVVSATARFVQLNAGQEAGEREVAAAALKASSATGPAGLRFRFESSGEWETVEGEIETEAAPAGEGLFRISARVRNRTSVPERAGAAREDLLTRSLIAAHLVLRVTGGDFVSLMDPPEACREAAQACRNAGVWPVLAGAPGARDCMLCSPIILYDYPEIAPESAGDLFDGTEIDELLTLRILTLTDEEKRAMREGDPRAREILERSEALPFEQLMKMHGALRGLKR